MSRRLNKNSVKIDNQIKRLKGAKREIARIAATIAQDFFKESFRDQGWTDRTFDPWEKRSAGAPRNEGRNILVDSGRLSDSISIISQKWNNVEVGSVGLDYAQVHNEGATITVPITEKMRDFFWHKWYDTGNEKWKAMALTPQESFQIDIPQRQFIGDSMKLRKEIERAVKRILNKRL